LLRAFVTTTEQQHNLLIRNCVVNAVTLTHINAQFPNTIEAKLVITEIAKLNAHDPPINCNPGPHITQAQKPIEVNIIAVTCDVMANII